MCCNVFIEIRSIENDRTKIRAKRKCTIFQIAHNAPTLIKLNFLKKRKNENKMHAYAVCKIDSAILMLDPL